MSAGNAPGNRGIVAIIPAYDEEPRIGAVVRAVMAHLPVIVVDDGSADATASAATAGGADVIEQRPNQGKGAALRTGFRRALELGCEAAITLDADGQHSAADVPALIEAYRSSGADLVVGRRDFRAMPLTRRLANALGRGAFSLAVGAPIPDNQSGYRLVGRRLMSAMLDSRETGFEFEVEMIVACVARGWTIAWVPIATIYAGAPSHIRPLRHLTSFVRMLRVARRAKSRAPLG